MSKKNTPNNFGGNNALRNKDRDPRINRQIKAQNLRIIIDGKPEVMTLQDALTYAESLGLDLVEISPDQDPPVCKVIDFGKWKFEQQKKKKDQIKNQHVIHIKEIKLRPKIGDHDYAIKKNQAQSFLEKGDKVKVSLRFRGREITHSDLGMAIMNRVVDDLADVAMVEVPAKFEGKQIIMVIVPKPGAKKKTPSLPSNSKKEIVKDE